MIHPRSLHWAEPRPPHAEWWCTDHARLIVADNRCPRCEAEQERQVAS